jgi:hypothetical protein
MRTEEGSKGNFKKGKKEARARNRHLPKEGLKKLRQMEKKIEKKNYIYSRIPLCT